MKLLALTALLARGRALSLPVLALTRRRLKKTSIYLFRKKASGWRVAHAISANSANSGKMQAVGTRTAAFHAPVWSAEN